jgi:phosphatidylglycerol---prolipoprotein diacylglyceryl transferase
MFSAYQNLPQHINPIAFQLGFFPVRWYSIMYILALAVFYCLITYRTKKGESKDSRINADLIINYLFWSFWGLVIGGRLGHVLIYNLSYYVSNPLEIISPFNRSGEYIGIYGMSFFGGLAGIVASSLLFFRKKQINIWAFSDFIIPAIPAGYFFGRIGNFLNGELYGKITKVPWGMYFPNAQAKGEALSLSHPVQIYEAILEGLLLFGLFWIFRNNPKLKGKFLGLYLIGYGCARFFCEFFREPEESINFLTISQYLSIAIAVCGIIILKKGKNRV